VKFKERTDKILLEFRPTVAKDVHGIIENIFIKFHLVVNEIKRRYDNRSTLEVGDEYDVQDLLRGLLRQHFDNIKDEVWTPEYAGSSARIDFLLPDKQIAIEVKRPKKGLGKKKLGDQLIIDIAHYQKNPNCKTLYCFVYDPEERISNPIGFERDLNGKHDNIFVRVLIVPRRA